eukprot:Rmarinus@m.11074
MVPADNTPIEMKRAYSPNRIDEHESGSSIPSKIAKLSTNSISGSQCPIKQQPDSPARYDGRRTRLRQKPAALCGLPVAKVEDIVRCAPVSSRKAALRNAVLAACVSHGGTDEVSATAISDGLFFEHLINEEWHAREKGRRKSNTSLQSCGQDGACSPEALVHHASTSGSSVLTSVSPAAGVAVSNGLAVARSAEPHTPVASAVGFPASGLQSSGLSASTSEGLGTSLKPYDGPSPSHTRAGEEFVENAPAPAEGRPRSHENKAEERPNVSGTKSDRVDPRQVGVGVNQDVIVDAKRLGVGPPSVSGHDGDDGVDGKETAVRPSGVGVGDDADNGVDTMQTDVGPTEDASLQQSNEGARASGVDMKYSGADAKPSIADVRRGRIRAEISPSKSASTTKPCKRIVKPRVRSEHRTSQRRLEDAICGLGVIMSNGFKVMHDSLDSMGRRLSDIRDCLVEITCRRQGGSVSALPLSAMTHVSPAHKLTSFRHVNALGSRLGRSGADGGTSNARLWGGGTSEDDGRVDKNRGRSRGGFLHEEGKGRGVQSSDWQSTGSETGPAENGQAGWGERRHSGDPLEPGADQDRGNHEGMPQGEGCVKVRDDEIGRGSAQDGSCVGHAQICHMNENRGTGAGSQGRGYRGGSEGAVPVSEIVDPDVPTGAARDPRGGPAWSVGLSRPWSHGKPPPERAGTYVHSPPGASPGQAPRGCVVSDPRPSDSRQLSPQSTFLEAMQAVAPPQSLMRGGLSPQSLMRGGLSPQSLMRG